MNCDEFVELVTAFLEGELPETDHQRVLEHLAECDGCTTYLAQFRTTIDQLARLPKDSNLPDSTRDTLIAAFRRKTV